MLNNLSQWPTIWKTFHLASGNIIFIALFSIVKIIFYHRFKIVSVQSGKQNSQSLTYFSPRAGIFKLFSALSVEVCEFKRESNAKSEVFTNTKIPLACQILFPSLSDMILPRNFFVPLIFPIIRISISLSDREKNCSRHSRLQQIVKK